MCAISRWYGRLFVFSFALAITPAVARDTLQVATYIEYDGGIIELHETQIDQLVGIPGALAAFEDKFLIDKTNVKLLKPGDTIVRVWQRDGDEWIIIHFEELGTTKRFHRSEIKIKVVDRPWIDEAALPELAPS
jgi:hypothetical protein